MRKRHILLGLALGLWCAESCVATPLPQPPSIELDIDKLTVEGTDGAPVVFVGSPGALSVGGIEVRVTPGPTDTDPILEVGTAPVDADGSFDVVVISPLENTYFFEAVLDDEDVFVAAVRVDATGNPSLGDAGPDSDEDGSPDVVDCAPDDPDVSGQRCP
jgi:hypothetical protein